MIIVDTIYVVKGFFMFSQQIFAERVKLLRIESGVTQSRLAELLGVTRTQVSDIENGKTTTSLERLYKLCQFFGVCSDYLLGLSDKPEVNR
jgi:transcriptional regulator with XRE-family HTH domain